MFSGHFFKYHSKTYVNGKNHRNNCVILATCHLQWWTLTKHIYSTYCTKECLSLTRLFIQCLSVVSVRINCSLIISCSVVPWNGATYKRPVHFLVRWEVTVASQTHDVCSSLQFLFPVSPHESRLSSCVCADPSQAHHFTPTHTN